MSLLFTHPGQTVFPLAVAYFLTMVTSLSRTGTERNSFAVGETCANDVCAGQNANFGPLLRFVLVDFFSELKELRVVPHVGGTGSVISLPVRSPLCPVSPTHVVESERGTAWDKKGHAVGQE